MQMRFYSICFFVLTWDNILNSYGSLYWFGYILSFAIILIAKILPKAPRKPRAPKANTVDTAEASVVESNSVVKEVKKTQWKATNLKQRQSKFNLLIAQIIFKS